LVLIDGLPQTLYINLSNVLQQKTSIKIQIILNEYFKKFNLSKGEEFQDITVR
jgi:hypothetical protein